MPKPEMVKVFFALVVLADVGVSNLVQIYGQLQIIAV